MKLTNDDVQAFAQAELNTFDLTKFELDKSLALKELREEIVTEWEELNGQEVMDARNNYFNIPNTSSSDYEEKLIDLGNDKKLIYGIRHMGGNKERPFVSLKPNFEIAHAKEALEIYDKIKKEFSVFETHYLSFWSPRKLDVDMIGSTYLVAKSGDTKARAPWNSEGELELKKILDDSYYKWYEAGYKEFHKEMPHLKDKVSINSLDAMNDSLEQGLMLEVSLNSVRAGLIAGEKSPLLGHAGIYFQEIFILKEFRGKGLAKAIQKKFIELFTSDEDFIWGTIDSDNLPSYKTALSNGRMPVRYECFVRVGV